MWRDGAVLRPFRDGGHGIRVGDIIDNLQFVGPHEERIELATFHRDPSARLLLIFATAGWIYWAGVEIEVFTEWYADYYEDGLRVLGVVFEDEEAAPADGAYSARHFGPDGYDVPFTYGADPPFVLKDYFDPQLAPLNMFIRTDTMEIIAIEEGFDEARLREIVETFLYGE
jgi:hypothetical protein